MPLSDRYSGAPIHACHAIDPVSGEELQLTMTPLPLEVLEMPLPELCSQTEAALDKILAPAMQAANGRELARVLRAAWEGTCAEMKLKAGDSLTDGQRWRFANSLARKLLPLIKHRLSDPFQKSEQA